MWIKLFELEEESTKINCEEKLAETEEIVIR